MKSSSLCLASATLVVATACTSSAPPRVDMSESLRVLGRENDVRIDAQLYTNHLGPSSLVTVVYEIHNLRSEPIVYAELTPTVVYHSETRTITVALGAEIPRADTFPKMIRIESGETRSFTAGARLSIPPSGSSLQRREPRYLQVRFNYLDGARAFEPYLRAEGAEKLDEGLFRKWVDHIAAIVTNTLPIRWGGSPGSGFTSATSRTPSSMFP